MNEKAVCEIAIKDIKILTDMQPRVGISQSVVADYADDMKAGAKFPPVVAFYDGKVYWLVDGFHRCYAAIKAGLLVILCDVRNGSREEAKWFSCAVNQTHGYRRTNADKAKAVTAALRHPTGAKMSDRQIAEHVGVSAPTVGKVRAELASTVKDLQSDSRTGADGRTIDTSNIGKQSATDDDVDPTDDSVEEADEAPYDPTDNYVYEEPANSDGTHGDPNRRKKKQFAMDIASMVIMQLGKIPKANPGREDAFVEVEQWIAAQRLTAKGSKVSGSTSWKTKKITRVAFNKIVEPANAIIEETQKHPQSRSISRIVKQAEILRAAIARII